MKLRTFFPYYGAKWRAAPLYPEPQHSVIVEPFAGAAGYSLHYSDRVVCLVDLNPTIIGLWDYLIHADPDAIMALPVDGFRHVDELGLDDVGARSLIGFWLNLGSAMPKKSAGAWANWTERTRERVASQLEFIRHWRLMLGSYAEIINVEATWFIDPPYVGAGKHYPRGSAYIDFSHLGSFSKERKGQVIVCENKGADWLPFRELASIPAGSGKRRAGVSHEVIWTNDDTNDLAVAA